MPKQLLIADDSYLVRETIKNVLAGRTDIAFAVKPPMGSRL